MTMLKTLFTAFLLAASALCASAKGVATFATTNHDFGNISAKGGVVTATYEFTNTGDEPISIVTVTNGGCHCTKPSFTLEPIKPGRKGQITVKFDPTSFRGEFDREVKVKFSTGRSRTKLTFSGVVVPSL